MRNKKIILLTIILMGACLTSFSSDVYTPALVVISHTLPGATLNLAQFSVAIFLFAVALSQLVFGPLSEVYGRRSPMLLGTAIMMVGTLLCMFSTHILFLIIGRLIQGLGAGALAALWRSVFRDTLSGIELAKSGSFVSIFIVFVTAVAPSLGGYLTVINWRLNFLAILIYALITFLVLWFVYKETSVTHHKDHLRWSYLVTQYGRLLKSNVFMGICCCTFLTYGMLFSWITTAPALLIDTIHLSPVTFGWLIALLGGTTYALSALLNAALVKKFGMANMMRSGWIIAFISGAALFGSYFMFGVTLKAVIPSIALLYLGTTFIWSNAFATAFIPFGDIAGYAGSLYGFMQLMGGSLIATFASHLPDKTQLPIACIIMITSLLAFIIHNKIVDRN